MIGRTHVQQVTLIALAAAAAVMCFVVVQPFIWPLVSAAALAVLLYPVFAFFRRRMRSREGIASGLTLIVLVVLVIAPSAWLISTMSKEAAQLYAALKDRSTAGGGWVEWLTQFAMGPLMRFGVDETTAREQVQGFLLERAETISGALLRVIRGVLSNIAGFLLNSVFTLFILFFLLRDGDDLLNRTREFLPLEEGVFDRLISEVGQSVLANVYGIGMVALAQGTLTGLLFWAVGVHSPVLWGVVAGFCSMIPVVGPPVVWLPVALALALSGNWGKAAVVAGVGAGVIGMADNFIRPWIISGRVQLHPLLVFISLLGGTQAFGFLGLFIGPAVLSVTIVIFEVLKWGMPGPEPRSTSESVAAEGPIL